MNKGDIVLIPFPFTNLTGSKVRPALILYVGQDDIVVAFITSQFKWQENHDVSFEPTSENGLKIRSLIKVSKLTTIERQLVLGRLGRLSIAELKSVDLALTKVFQIKVQ